MQYFSVYIRFIKISILSVSHYRSSFILGIISQIISFFSEFFLLWLLLNNFKAIGNWATYEVMFLFAINLASYAIGSFFLNSPSTRLSTMIKDGTFDEVLTKPLNSFIYLVCREFNNGYITHLVVSLVVMVICINQLNIELTFTNICMLILMLLGGALIQGSTLLIISIPSFWFIENTGLREVLFFNMRRFISYPITIYDKFIQILLTYILPYAFINFFPAQYFLQKNDFSIFSPFLQYATPIIGLVLFIIAYSFWKIGINHYQSTGS